MRAPSGIGASNSTTVVSSMIALCTLPASTASRKLYFVQSVEVVVTWRRSAQCVDDAQWVAMYADDLARHAEEALIALWVNSLEFSSNLDPGHIVDEQRCAHGRARIRCIPVLRYRRRTCVTRLVPDSHPVGVWTSASVPHSS